MRPWAAISGKTPASKKEEGLGPPFSLRALRPLCYTVPQKKGATAMLYPALLTLAAWLVGLFIDANTFSDAYLGFLELRVLLPVLTMGLCVLWRLERRDKGEKP